MTLNTHPPVGCTTKALLYPTDTSRNRNSGHLLKCNLQHYYPRIGQQCQGHENVAPSRKKSLMYEGEKLAKVRVTLKHIHLCNLSVPTNCNPPKNSTD